MITDEKNPEHAAKKLLDMGPLQVVIKQGAHGALGVTKDEQVYAPALKVEPVETVGAGDAFNAGFLSGQLRGWNLTKSLHLGNIMGAMATTVPGDVEGLPDWAEIQPFLGGEQTVER